MDNRITLNNNLNIFDFDQSLLFRMTIMGFCLCIYTIFWTSITIFIVLNQICFLLILISRSNSNQCKYVDKNVQIIKFLHGIWSKISNFAFFIEIDKVLLLNWIFEYSNYKQSKNKTLFEVPIRVFVETNYKIVLLEFFTFRWLQYPSFFFF